ncbi:hypothetical protein ACFOGJ_27865 [Marinibaculum pumilum]|uniref:Lipoprotein n=1 Tax=Marinibaculum pumilum TaxID=1766165 RepID=A0ABV7L9L3_9PROT
MPAFPPLKLIAAGMACLALSACGNVPELLMMGESRSAAVSRYALESAPKTSGCVPEERSGAQIQKLPAPSVALLLGGFSLATTAASDAAADAVKAKAKRFSRTFVVATNVESFSPTKDKPACFLVERQPKLSTDGTPLGDNSDMKLLLRFTPFGAGAVTVEPVELRVTNGFLASTLPDDRTASYDVSVGMAVIPGPGEDRWLVPAYNQNIRISDIALDKSYTGGELLARMEANTTALMPDPAGRPVTVAVSVTEHGSGAERLGGFDEARYKANAALIRTALGNYLKERVTAE